MEIPADPNAWTYETVLDVVRTTEYEPGSFDFKEVLNASRGGPDHAASIRRAACGLANTAGGHIVFGVTDRARKGENQESRIVGIPLGGDLGKEFADKVKMVRPPLAFVPGRAPIGLPHDPARGIFVVQVPLSPSRPHEFDGTFPRRTDGGSAEPMSAYEVRDQMLYTEDRLRKLRLLRLELLSHERLADQLRGLGPAVHSIPRRFDPSALKPLIADTCPLFNGDALIDALIEIPVLALAVNKAMDLARLETGQQGRDLTDPLIRSAAGVIDQLLNACRRALQNFDHEFGVLLGLARG
jgi:hypothetical protein